MGTALTGFDPTTLSRLAYKRIGRRGLRWCLEAEDLVSVGATAILAAGTPNPALAVRVARNAMFDVIRREARRVKGRVEVRTGESYCCDGESPSVGDMWDSTVHHGQHLQPEAKNHDLWEAMKSLPARQYQAITLTYWAGMSDEAVAVEMGISSQAVDALLKKAQRNIAAGVGIAIPHTLTHVRGKEEIFCQAVSISEFLQPK